MSQYKKRLKMYAAWEYDKEEEALNNLSQKGMQLVNGGLFVSTFQKNEDLRYLYQLDFNTNIGDKSRYKEAFEDQGWEYINSTFNGWHYFRKLYKEGMDEKDYKIYTDKESLKEMQNRWVHIANILSVFYFLSLFTFVFRYMDTKENFWAVNIVLYTLIFVAFRLGVRTLNLKIEGKKSKINISIQFLIACLLFGFVLMFTLLKFI